MPYPGYLTYPKSYVRKVSKKMTKSGVKNYPYYTCKFFDPVLGKEVYFSAKKKVDCQRKVRAYVDRVNRGLSVEPDLTFHGQKTEYLAGRKEFWTVREWKNQVSYLNHFDFLSRYDVSEITSEDIRTGLKRMADGTGMRADRPASRELLMKCRTAVKQMWDFLLEKNLVSRNIVETVELPRFWGQEKQSRSALSDEQIKWIEDTPDPCQVLAMVMLYAGLRTSEACALQGQDVHINRDYYDDPVSNYIEVSHTLDLSTGAEKSTLKTKAGYRRIPLCRKLYDFLCGLSPVSDTEYICFPKESDNPVTAQCLRVLWQRYQMHLDQKYGNPDRRYVKTEKSLIPEFTTYQCRHTFCTLCYESGLDIPTTAYLMGHSDLRMTENVYTHLREEHKSKELPKLKTLGTG